MFCVYRVITDRAVNYICIMMNHNLSPNVQTCYCPFLFSFPSKKTRRRKTSRIKGDILGLISLMFCSSGMQSLGAGFRRPKLLPIQSMFNSYRPKVIYTGRQSEILRVGYCNYFETLIKLRS